MLRNAMLTLAMLGALGAVTLTATDASASEDGARVHEATYYGHYYGYHGGYHRPYRHYRRHRYYRPDYYC